MTGRAHSYTIGHDGQPIVHWSSIPDEALDEDAVIRRLDTERALREFVQTLTKIERRALLFLLNGEGVPREHRNAVASLRAKAVVTNLAEKVLSS